VPYDIIIVMQFLIGLIILTSAHFQHMFLSTHLHNFPYVFAHVRTCSRKSPMPGSQASKHSSQRDNHINLFCRLYVSMHIYIYTYIYGERETLNQ